jgi:hypothetical protein
MKISIKSKTKITVLILLFRSPVAEQRSVVCFLWPKGHKAKDIHKEMFPVYGGKCLSCKAVHNWVQTFH